MRFKIGLPLLLLIVYLSSVTCIGAGVKVIPVSESSWTCYDHSINYAKNNPGWGCVTMSDNQHFYGVSHMVNYQLIDNDIIKIHDGLYGADYTLSGWREEGFYHFWLNGERPVRNYFFLQDNSHLIN